MADDDRLDLTDDEKAAVIKHATRLAADVREELEGMEENTPEWEFARVELIALERLINDPENRRHLDGAYDARMMRSMMGWPAP